MGKYTALIQNRRFVTGKEMFLLYKYSRRNSIVRIRRNVYLPTNPVDGFVDENKYEIGCNSVPGSYLSYHSAMEFYGLQNQVWNRIYLSSAKRFRPFEFEFVEYMYAPDRHREGIVRPAEHVSVRVTDMERTILDCIDQPDLAGGLEELVYNLELMGTVDEDRLLRYLPLYGKSVIYQKTWFNLSLFKDWAGNFSRHAVKRQAGVYVTLPTSGSKDIYSPVKTVCPAVYPILN